MNWDETREFLSPCFPEEIRSELALMQRGELRELRVRAERPTMLVTATRTAAVDWRPGAQQLDALIEALSGHSLYARTEETGQGFLTLRGGHRMGLCGRVVMRGGRAALAEVGSVCLRIASEWPGAADAAAARLRAVPGCGSLLVIGPPGSGKTTLLRDLARQLSAGRHGLQTAVVDERGELAACVDGVPQLDVGAADVLTGLSKAQALPWLVRSMSPRLIVTDELGANDAEAVLSARSCGVAVCASAHGTSLSDAASRPELAALMARRVFDLYAVLPAEAGGAAAFADRTGSPVAP
ncbi:MAG: stage III sporulation protein AA [Aristaeellaceae bacterium]